MLRSLVDPELKDSLGFNQAWGGLGHDALRDGGAAADVSGCGESRTRACKRGAGLRGDGRHGPPSEAEDAGDGDGNVSTPPVVSDHVSLSAATRYHLNASSCS